MAEGALNQMNPMAAIAGGGNDLQAQMFQQMLDTSKKKQSYLEQQQEAYNADMEKYAQMVQQSQQPDSREAQMWGSMAGAASSVAPTWGNIGAMLGKTGEAYGNFQAADQQLNLKNQSDLTKLRQNEVRALESKDQQAAMLRAMAGKAQNPTIKVVDGKLVKYDPVTGGTEVLSGSQDQIKSKLFQTFYNKAVANEMENPEAYAQQQVEKTLGQFGGTTVTGKSNGIPGARSSAPQLVEQPPQNTNPVGAKSWPEINSSVQASQPQKDTDAGKIMIAEEGGTPASANARLAELDKAVEEAKGDAKGILIGERNRLRTGMGQGQATAQLSSQDQELAARLIARINANPEAAGNDVPRLQQILGKYQDGAQPQPAPVAQPASQAAPALTYVDKQKRKEEESYGAGVGKHMADTTIDLQKTGAAAQSLIGDLNTLESLYKEHGDKIPEGALGPVLNTMKSGLTTFGVDVKGQGAADMVNAIATKQALKARTADGENMLPGAMSNYEDRLLQSMSPGMLMTQDGRLLAIQVAKAQMQMRVDLATAARAYRKEHKRLDEGWFDVAADIGAKNPFLDEKRVRALEAYSKSLNKGAK